MRDASLLSLKSKLGEYVRLPAGDEPALVVDGSRAVVTIVPPRKPVAPFHDLMHELGQDRRDR